MKKYKLLKPHWYKILSIAFFLLLLGAPNVFAAPTPGKIIDSNCPKGEVICILKNSIKAIINTSEVNTVQFINDSQIVLASLPSKIKSTYIASKQLGLNTTASVGDSITSVGNFLTSVSEGLASGWSAFTYGLLNNITDSVNGTKEFAVSVGDGAKFIGNGIREGWTSTENFVASLFDKKTNSLVVAPIIKTPTPITVIPPPIVSTPPPPIPTEIPTPTEIIPVPKQIIQSGLTGQMGPRGLTGLQGPRGEAGRDGNIVDTSSFVSKTFLDAQVAGIFDSISNITQGLPITLTTTGTSGASTLIGNTLNIPQYSGGSGMVYPSAGIALSTGSAWGTSISGTSSQFVKGDGSLDSSTYLTGITSGQVTGALGFTPYDAINPSVYIANATGLISAGTNVTLTGSGTSGSPYVINSTGGGGGVTTIGVTTANGVSGSSSGGTTPSLTIALGAITPTSINGLLVNQGTNSVTGNTAVGALALDAANSGTGKNTAVGYQALSFNTTGNNNTAQGYNALFTNSIGSFNSAQGAYALYYTTGSSNSAQGSQALFQNTTGNDNTAIGNNTLYLNSTGNNNVALGYDAGRNELGSNAFYINNIDQVNTAGDKAYSLLYGQFSGVAGSLTGQQLTVNGTLNVNGNVGIGMTPAYKLDVNGAINATSVLINGVAVGAGGTQWASGSGGVISYTGGNVGIGTPTPTALLQLAAGTATANTAPLKLTSGTLLGTAEAGAIEFLTDAYYGTITTGAARKTFAFLDSAITPTSVNGLLVNQGTNSVTGNTAVGVNALDAANSGSGGNTAIGYQALTSNTTGYSNTANGMQALTSNTTGYNNTANGYAALYSNTTGYYNTANGRDALYYNTTGSKNTANGLSALLSNSVGNNNVALGYSAGRFELGSNAFYINNISQVTTAGDKAYSLLYGQFSGTAGSLTGQQLTVNGDLNVNGTISTATGIKNSTSIDNAYVQTSTTGIILSRNVADANSAVTIQQQNSSSSGTALTVTNSGTGYGLRINQNGPSSGLYVITDGGAATSGLGRFIATNVAFNQSVLSVSNAGTGTALDISNNSTGTGIKLNQYGTGYGLYAITDVGAASYGLGRFVATNAAFNQSVLSVSNAGTGTALDISNSGTGYGINLNQSGTGYGFYVNSGAASANSSLGKFVTTNATFNQSVLNVSNAGTGTGLDISQGTTGTGTGLSVYSNVDATSNSSLAILSVDNAAFDNTVLSITNDGTGTGLNISGNGTGATINTSSSTLTSGSLANFTITGTGALNGQKGINVSVSGANSTGVQTTYGAYISNTHAGTTSTNVGLYATATGGTTANYAAVFPAGFVGIGTVTPVTPLQVFGAGNLMTLGDTALTTKWFTIRDSASNGFAFGLSTTGSLGGVDGVALIRAGGNKGFAVRVNDTTSFDTVNKVDFVIDKNHNAGFGLSNPSANLQVSQPTAGIGTVTTNGTTTLTGDTNTQFTNTFKVGDTITVSGESVRTISSITNNTTLVVTVAFTTSAPALSYTLTGGIRFSVLGNGNVGIGTTSPGTMLTIGTASTNTGNITVYGTVGTCVLGDSISGASCSSDLNLKDHVNDLGSELNNIMALRPITFTWKDTTKNQGINTGLIAQEVQTIYPNVVHTIYNDILGIDYAALVVPAIKAIQEMNLKINDLSSLDTTSATSLGSLIKNFLADVTNSITDLYASVIHSDRVETKTLCVGDTCVTEEQFLEMVNNNISNPVTSETPTIPVIAPAAPANNPPAEPVAPVVQTTVPATTIPTESPVTPTAPATSTVIAPTTPVIPAPTAPTD